jgi:hypothetical protein
MECSGGLQSWTLKGRDAVAAAQRTPSALSRNSNRRANERFGRIDPLRKVQTLDVTQPGTHAL